MRWSKKDKFYFKNLDKIEIEKSGRTEKAGKDTLFFFVFYCLERAKNHLPRLIFRRTPEKYLIETMADGTLFYGTLKMTFNK